MNSALRLLLCFWLSSVIFLAGCTPNRAYHLADSMPPLPLVPTADWDEPNGIHDKDFFEHPSVAVIEFDENGKLWPCGTDQHNPYCEVNRAVKYIEQARENRDGKNVTVITYVHGWHHDASDSSENFRNFQTLVHCLNWGDPRNGNRYQKNVIHERKDPDEPVICTGMRPDPSTLYVGVYIGWRGESVSRKLGLVTYLSLLSRHAAAARMAANEADDGFEKTVLRLSQAAKEGDKPARFVLFGHSFGGLIVNRAATTIFEKRLALPNNLTAGACDDGRSVLFNSFADLVVVINPADSSLHVADFAARFRYAQAMERKVPPNPCEQTPLNTSLRHPLLLTMHTTSDSATDTLGSSALKLGFWIDRDYMNQMAKDWKGRPYQDEYLDDPPSVSMLRRNTINHVDYLRNLCYIDQPNRQDEICLGLADNIHDLKRKLYKQIVKEGDPQPLNPKYSRDPYYHGAYELLTSVCTEAWEVETNLWSKDHQFQADFENRGSCRDKENNETDKGAERRQLHEAFQQQLKDYLAFPQEATQIDDDLLLDIYRRFWTGKLRCGDVKVESNGQITQPKPCKADRSEDLFQKEPSWNDSPVWTLNTSYEILQSHSGIWNTDAASIFMGIANQFPVVPYDDAYQQLPSQVPEMNFSQSKPRPMLRGHHSFHWPFGQQQQQQQQQQE